MGPESSLTRLPRGRPLRVVFDTNVVVSALVFGRRLAWLRMFWAQGAVIPVVCRETTAELVRVLAYPKFRLDKTERENLLADYLPYAEATVLPDALPGSRSALPLACRDRDDAIFVMLAVAAKVDLLVSGDGDLAALRKSAPVRVASARELRELLRE